VAVIVPGPIVADIRGKVGGNTFSRNQGGLYVKANPVWEQPASEWRDATQYTTKTLPGHWSTDLTPTQRQRWQNYATQNPRPNRWGHPTLHNGYAFWFRANFYNYWQTASVTYFDPPTIPPTGPIPFTMTRKGATQDFTVTFGAFPFPATETDIVAWTFDMQPGTLGQSGTRGPWRFIGTYFLTKGSLPIVTDISCTFTLAANQHRAIRCVGQWLNSGAFASTSWAQCYT